MSTARLAPAPLADDMALTPPASKAREADDQDSLALALRLQAEDDSRFAYDGHTEELPEGDDPELEASIALAIQLQQQEDDAQLRAALLGVPRDELNEDDMRPVSPSQLNYEDLQRLGENVGKVTRGTSNESLDCMRVLSHAECCRAGSTAIVGEQCSICRMEFDTDDQLRVLPCKHAEHQACVDEWLKVSHKCPVCQQDVDGDDDCTAEKLGAST